MERCGDGGGQEEDDQGDQEQPRDREQWVAPLGL